MKYSLIEFAILLLMLQSSKICSSNNRIWNNINKIRKSVCITFNSIIVSSCLVNTLPLSLPLLHLQPVFAIQENSKLEKLYNIKKPLLFSNARERYYYYYYHNHCYYYIYCNCYIYCCYYCNHFYYYRNHCYHHPYCSTYLL